MCFAKTDLNRITSFSESRLDMNQTKHLLEELYGLSGSYWLSFKGSGFIEQSNDNLPLSSSC